MKTSGYLILTITLSLCCGEVFAKQKKEFTDPITGMEFVFVKGGCYQMGDTFGDGGPDERPVHEVCVDGFYIGKYEVIQGEYQKITGKNPSRFKNGDRYPVEQVSWVDTQVFIRELNNRSHRTFRLPTEAEWEYAARSGSNKKEKYAGSSSIDSIAWYSDNSGGKTHQVGTKNPNSLGIYDMSGNVFELCRDWYGEEYYKNSPRTNPKGPSSGSVRVVRGGCWDFPGWDCRTANRILGLPNDRYSGLGFRLVLQALE